MSGAREYYAVCAVCAVRKERCLFSPGELGRQSRCRACIAAANSLRRGRDPLPRGQAWRAGHAKLFFGRDPALAAAPRREAPRE